MSEVPNPAPIGVPEFDVADRMRKALRASDVAVQDIADYLEVSRNTVGRWINGHAQPSGQTIRLWAMRTGVNYEWLRTGRCPRQDSNLQPTGYSGLQRRHLAVAN